MWPPVLQSVNIHFTYYDVDSASYRTIADLQSISDYAGTFDFALRGYADGDVEEWFHGYDTVEDLPMVDGEITFADFENEWHDPAEGSASGVDIDYLAISYYFGPVKYGFTVRTDGGF